MNKIESMKKAGNICKYIFKKMEFILEPGTTTKYINEDIELIIEANELQPVFHTLVSDGVTFGSVSSISINEEVCHGIPSDRKIGGGDLVSIDIGVQCDGYIVDTCRTFQIGEVSKEKELLNHWTKEALFRAIQHIRAGICWQEVAAIIENTAKKHKLSVVKSLCGHGVNTKLHDAPMLRNYTCAANELIFLEEGETIAVEPMFAIGESGDVEISPNKWTILTQNRSMSAHWEHTVLVTANGCEILT